MIVGDIIGSRLILAPRVIVYCETGADFSGTSQMFDWVGGYILVDLIKMPLEFVMGMVPYISFVSIRVPEDLALT